ncbi:MAG TPA: hypothetical protein PKJ19_08530, partial [Flavobacteriales bacterium]|nr:hypothetical protein [Flavobacteriales bacterium]
VGGVDRLGVFDVKGKLVIPAEHDEIIVVNEAIVKVVNDERSAYRRVSDAGYIWKEAGFRTAPASAE